MKNLKIFLKKTFSFRKKSLPEFNSTSLQEIQRCANAHIEKQEYAKAEHFYSKAVNIYPEYISGYVGSAFSLLEQGKVDDAERILHTAELRFPVDFDICVLLAEVAEKKQDIKRRAQKLELALSINPNSEFLYTQLAQCYLKNNDWQAIDRIIENGLLNFPKSASINYLKGNLEAEKGFHESALIFYGNVKNNEFVYPETLANTGVCQTNLGKINEAIESFESAIFLNDNFPAWHSNLLLAYQQQGRLDRSALYRMHCKFGEKFEGPLISNWPTHATKPNRKRLRIGYVSGDFREHSVAFFIEPVLRNHDREKFEVYCYSNHRTIDKITETLRSLADKWHQVENLDDEQCARLIKKDEIDILIDLSGHTGHNRLLTFARKPAPLQATWIGYQATTGLKSMDYRITDLSMDPMGLTEAFHSEKLMRIESSAWFQPLADSPVPNQLPALLNGYITFGCFNNAAKINQKVLETWAKILTCIKDSRIIIGNSNAESIQIANEIFSKYGISENRVTFEKKKNIDEYLAMHLKIDIQLDTFPYNGGTTTLHSVWMGVPVLTIEGDSSISRAGASIMSGVAMNDFIADSIDNYIQRAVDLSKQIEFLSTVRVNLRSNFEKSIISKNEFFTRSLECKLVEAYHMKWNTND